MDIRLTPAQTRLVDFDPEGPLLVRGQAGSGKTTVLLERAKGFLAAYPRATVLVLAFNEALAARFRRHLGMAEGRLEVRTLHDWARTLARHEGVIFGKGFWVDSATRERFLEEILKRPPAPLEGTRMAAWTPQAWSAEVEWILGQDLDSAEAYRDAERKGRGRSGGPAREDRDAVWAVYRRLREDLEARGRHDLHDIHGLIRKAEARSGRPLPQKASFDFVLVDEVQDLDLAWLRAVASVARVGATFAGDFAQAIYRRHFTWKAAGIELPPARSRALPATHRHPQAVVDLAGRILGPQEPGVEAPGPSLVPGEGEAVVLIRHARKREALRRALERAAHLRAEGRDVVVAAPFRRLAEEAVALLAEGGTPAGLLQRGDLADRDGRVLAVTTFHQMKGLECEDIVLLGLEDGLFPGWYLKEVEPGDGPDVEAELRRLLHMVVTRARRTVTLCAGGETSRFLVP
ncbi:MAG TPA: UvrD-helicase domain-containing protein [Holophaga sp.]|nr:UvrD-helicase domain-containing protein [Holophaga sp.]